MKNSGYKQVEERPRVNKKFQKTILDFTRTGIMIIDSDMHNIVYVNSFAMEMIGVRKDEILGHLCHGYICPAEVGKCPITDLKQNVYFSERQLIKANGERIPVLKSIVPVRQNGRSYLIESFIDISEQKRLEGALSKSGDKDRLIEKG